MKLTLFQTLEDRNNPEEVELDGPFECTRTDAWLGRGYYFWDTHIELAHWWGNKGYRTKYIICRADGRLDENCWDLHGNGAHRLEFEEICKELISKRIFEESRLIVPKLIMYLKKNNIFVYSSIRALGSGGGIADPLLKYRIKFKNYDKTFLDLRPPVQICLLEKQALSLSGYSIVYPEHYIEYPYA